MPPLDIDEPSLQLLTTLRSSITEALSTRRPLLTHLNADTTWLFSLPYPEKETKRERGRMHYHILLDPWLKGGQSDVARFFSQQWHKEESCVQSIEEVEDVIRGIEDVAREDGYISLEEEEGEEADEMEEKSAIDAVIISHEFTDHMHKETLLEIPSSVPIFATSKAAGIIRSWRHFHKVFNIHRFDGDWRNSSMGSLPGWVGVSRVAYEGMDLLYYHSAIMVAFSSSPNTTSPKDGKRKGKGKGNEEEEAQAILYTPHGISPSNLTPLLTSYPKVHILALLHGLQDIQIKATWTLEAQLNKGAHNGLKVMRLLGATYWIGTHDEVKRGGGIISWFLRRKVIGLEEAVELERRESGVEGGGEGMGEVRFVELGNGESLILE